MYISLKSSSYVNIPVFPLTHNSWMDKKMKADIQKRMMYVRYHENLHFGKTAVTFAPREIIFLFIHRLLKNKFGG